MNLRKGECQFVEFKRQFPSTASKLGKEIAAFATSNQGSIYLGIENNGNIVGVAEISDINDIQAKDQYQLRITGITPKINPPIRVSVLFIEWNGKIIVEIIVPKGIEPVYYFEGVPYLRDLSTSRKATPEEVKGLITGGYNRQEFLKDLVNSLSDFEVIWSDLENRNVNPYLTQMLAEFKRISEVISDLKSNPISKELEISQELERLKENLDELVYHQYWTRPFWQEFIEKGNNCSETVKELYESTLSKAIINDALRPDLDEKIKEKINEMKKLWGDREIYLERVLLEEFQNNFYKLAIEFHRLGSLPISDIYNDLSNKLKRFGKRVMTLSSSKYFRRGLGDPFIWIVEVIDDYFSEAEEIIRLIT